MNVTEETIRGLHDRRFDLGLISLPVPEENLKIIPLFDEELLIVRPSTSKVRGPQTGSVRVSELARVPFLLYPMGTVRVLIDRFFTDIGMNPHVVMEAEDTEAIKRLVESGFGYSILPEHAPATYPFFPDLSGRWSSHNPQSGAGDGANRLSPKAHRVDCRVVADGVDRLSLKSVWKLGLASKWEGLGS